MSTRPGTARIVYATHPTSRRSGGVHVMSEHVRLLRSAGWSAWLWLPGPGGAPDWFDAAAPVLVGPTIDVGPDDLLVLPEVPLVPGQDPAPGARTVVFNQNHFYTFAASAASAEAEYPGWRRRPSVWTVSRESADVLRAVHPDLSVTVLPNPVATELFQPRPSSGPSVAWFSRKRPLEAGLVRRLLANDPRMAGVALHDITDEPWSAVAETLGAATVFLALGHTEGFGLPAAEALAAGCLLVGYDGGGGSELFEAPGAWQLPEQRPLLLAERVANLIERRAELRDLPAANRAWVLERYSAAHTLDALTSAVEAVLATPGAAATAVHPARWLDQLPPNFHLTA